MLCRKVLGFAPRAAPSCFVSPLWNGSRSQSSMPAAAAAVAAAASTVNITNTAAAANPAAVPSYKTPHRTTPPPPSTRSDAPRADASFPAGASCRDEGPAAAKPLTALQRRQLEQKDKMVFRLTPNAVYRVKTLLSQRHRQAPGGHDSDVLGIRIGVKKRGCSGYSYTVNYEERTSPKKPDDNVVKQNDVSIFVDGDALFYVIGTEMDFLTTIVEEKFTFQNPNSKAACGCGESFMPFDV